MAMLQNLIYSIALELARNPLGNYEGSQAEQYDESKVPSDKDWEQ